MARRFPRPWRVDGNDACYWVEDASGAKLAYVYFLTRDRLSHDGEKLEREDALKIARNIAKLPDLLLAARDEVK